MIVAVAVLVVAIASAAAVFWPRGSSPESHATTPAARLSQLAGLSSPSAIAIAPDGTVYIADRDKLRVQRVSPTGTVDTYAGTGEAGDSGDGRTAKTATLTDPLALALAKDGTLFVVSNGRVRQIDPDGVIRPVSGFGDDYMDIAALAVAGDGTLYVAREDAILVRASNGAVRTLVSTGFGKITAMLARPDGSLLVADVERSQVVQVDAAGTVLRVAGLGTDVDHPAGDGYPANATALSSPAGIAVDSAGRLYVSESGVNRVRHVQPDGTLLTVAGNPDDWSSGYTGDGGSAIAATFDLGLGPLAVDSSGNLFIGDINNHRIRRVGADGTVQTWA